jgi:hypothetical protein
VVSAPAARDRGPAHPLAEILSTAEKLFPDPKEILGTLAIKRNARPHPGMA